MSTKLYVSPRGMALYNDNKRVADNTTPNLLNAYIDLFFLTTNTNSNTITVSINNSTKEGK